MKGTPLISQYPNCYIKALFKKLGLEQTLPIKRIARLRIKIVITQLLKNYLTRAYVTWAR